MNALKQKNIAFRSHENTDYADKLHFCILTAYH